MPPSHRRRFPEVTFNEVSSLLQSKLADVRSKSFDCTTIGVEVEAFDVFREHVFAGKGNIPVLITLEVRTRNASRKKKRRQLTHFHVFLFAD